MDGGRERNASLDCCGFQTDVCVDGVLDIHDYTRCELRSCCMKSDLAACLNVLVGTDP